mmetsp:Transcript_6880/g.24820  ORF Transcript_6880/g.24820 Transcript_6880/m.24820 type:complete len:728 (-) Transcript_6880:870-3053(-)
MSSWWDDRQLNADDAALVKVGKENAKNQPVLGGSSGNKARGKGWGSASVPTQPADPKVKQPYYDKRIALFEKYFERTQFDAAEAAKEGVKISITLPDGAVREGTRYVTTPKDVATGISKRLGKEALVAKVDGQDWDVFRPLEGDCKLQIFTFDSAEGKYTYWHSTAHLLGQALELEYGADLTIGPPIEEGFYYDCFMGDKTLHPEDSEVLTKRIDKIIKEKQEFQRAVVTREEALHMFQENPFKVEVIEGLPEGSTITLYRNGPFCDLCRGPHVPDTGMIKAFQLNQNSRAFWRGDVQNAPLNRVYGVSFPDKKLLKKYVHKVEEAKKRDHRKLGAQLNLFSIQQEGAGGGLVFWHPKGAMVRNQIEEHWRGVHLASGYDLVYTPHIANIDLWKTSGHLDFYGENMFQGIKIDEDEYQLRPMNCPFHVTMYKNEPHSYRELPLRWAELGTVYRYERSGALHGLFRVRGFTQDDAHIFCLPSQVTDEIEGVLNLTENLLSAYGFTEYEINLSTRPEKYVGSDEIWEMSESALKEALSRKGWDYIVDDGGGAFYGPKIDVKIKDAIGRKWQCSTIQVDFNLPERFDMEYVDEENNRPRPIMIHRAIFGSVERFMGVLIESYAGLFPLWLAPTQARIVCVNDSVNEYAKECLDLFKSYGLRVDMAGGESLGKLVRNAEVQKIPLVFVVGNNEVETRTLSVRSRHQGDLGAMGAEDIARAMNQAVVEKSKY